MVNKIAERAEQVRDLKGQVADLTAEEMGEVMFIDASPRRNPVVIYSMLTGEPITLPALLVRGALENKLPDGRYAFTSDPNKAPSYKQGEIKCFLHPDSPDRLILNQIGLAGAFCPAAHLANDYSKRMHAQHRHRKQWEAYQDYLGQQRDNEYRQRQEQQLEATLAIARAAGGIHGEVATIEEPAEEPSTSCDKCGREMAGTKCAWCVGETIAKGTTRRPT